MLPLTTSGTNIVCQTRTPTQIELESCPHITLFSSHPWDPQSIQFPEPLHSVEEGVTSQCAIGSTSATLASPNLLVDIGIELYNPDSFNRRLISSCNVTTVPRAKKRKRPCEVAAVPLRVFCNEFGVPDHLILDGSLEQTGKRTEFMKQVRKHDIQVHLIEPERHNQSYAEGVVREIRRCWYRVMFKKRVPRRLWDYGFRWVCEVMQHAHVRSHRIDGGVPLEITLGETVDISEYLDFGFYDRVWYHDNAGLGDVKLGCCLGVSHHVGSLMCYYILSQNGSIIAQSSVQRVTNVESNQNSNRQRFCEFDTEIKQRFHDNKFPC